MPFAAAAAFIGGATVVEAVAAVTILGAITTVGAVLSVVGMVTGNKDLAMIGGVMGIVGGVGALASSSGLLGDIGAGSLFGTQTADSVSVAADATAETADAGAAVDTAGTSYAGAPPPTEVTSAPIGNQADVIDSLSGKVNPIAAADTPATPAANAPNVTPDAAKALGPPTDTNPTATSAATDAAKTDAARALGPPTNTNTTVSTADGLSSSPTGLINNSTGNFDVGGGATPGAAPSPSGSSGNYDFGSAASGGQPNLSNPPPSTPDGVNPQTAALIKAMNDSTFRQTVISGGLQAGGALLKGLFDPVTPAQIDQLKSQAALNNAATQLSLTQQANMAKPLPVANKVVPANITGRVGMINSSAVQQPQVTGAPA